MLTRKLFILYIFCWRATVCWHSIAYELRSLFMRLNGCLDSKPEYYHSKRARYQLNKPIPRGKTSSSELKSQHVWWCVCVYFCACIVAYMSTWRACFHKYSIHANCIQWTCIHAERTVIKKNEIFSYIRKFRWVGCKVIAKEGLPNLWWNAQIFNHIWGGR